MSGSWSIQGLQSIPIIKDDHDVPIEQLQNSLECLIWGHNVPREYRSGWVGKRYLIGSPDTRKVLGRNKTIRGSLRSCYLLENYGKIMNIESKRSCK